MDSYVEIDKHSQKCQNSELFCKRLCANRAKSSQNGDNDEILCSDLTPKKGDLGVGQFVGKHLLPHQFCIFAI